MFVIKPISPADWRQAMFMLSYYREIKIATFSNGEDVDTAYMVVSVIDDIPGFPEDGMVSEHTLELVEMAFQMNWLQAGKICPHCEGEQNNYWSGFDGKDTCGHLTFSKPIDSRAFDRALGIS